MTINRAYLDAITYPLIDMGDVNEVSDYYSRVDPSNFQHYVRITDRLFVPYLRLLDTCIFNEIKLVFAYYLQRDYDWRLQFGNAAIPVPQDSTGMYRLIWNRLFGQELYESIEFEEVDLIDDPRILNSLPWPWIGSDQPIVDFESGPTPVV